MADRVGTLEAHFRMMAVCILQVLGGAGNHSPWGSLQENTKTTSAPSSNLPLLVLFVPRYGSFLPDFLLHPDATEKVTLVAKGGPFKAVFELVPKATASIFCSPTGPSDESQGYRLKIGLGRI